MVSPGLRMPAFSASSTIRKLILSLTLPPALKYSHLATTNTEQKHFHSESWNDAIDLEWPSFVAFIIRVYRKQILWYNTSGTTTPVFTWCQWLTHSQQSHLLSKWECVSTWTLHHSRISHLSPNTLGILLMRTRGVSPILCRMFGRMVGATALWGEGGRKQGSTKTFRDTVCDTHKCINQFNILRIPANIDIVFPANTIWSNNYLFQYNSFFAKCHSLGVCWNLFSMVKKKTKSQLYSAQFYISV